MVALLMMGSVAELHAQGIIGRAVRRAASNAIERNVTKQVEKAVDKAVDDAFEEIEKDIEEEVEEIEQPPNKDLHSRAVWCVARLRNCGWLEDLEIGYEEDARTAICPQVVPILQAFHSIVHPQTVTYSGKLNKAYQLLKTHIN